jgi:dephospho-CoA kinase
MLKIGLTGGIGSGKSLVAKIFACLGVPVFNADDASKFLLATNNDIQLKVIELLGNEAFENGKPNKTFIANAVFSNAAKLAGLNAILHPAVISYGEAWMSQQTAPYAIKEAAILFESNSHKNLDAIIGVNATEALRIQRAMQRDNATEDAIKSRIVKQMNEDEKMKLCTYVINNDEVEALIPQVLKLHKELMGN